MNELAYVLITPYSLLKSRTGGIIARILSNNDLELRAVKMYAPSDKMVDEYIDAIKRDKLSQKTEDLFCRYIEQNLRVDNPSRISNRCILLLFEGEDAVDIIKRAVGFNTFSAGDSVRITYGDYICHGETIVYFEPAVLCAPHRAGAKTHLKVFRKYAASDGGVLIQALARHDNKKYCETTLVMVKPDNFRKKSTRPGNIIDMFSQTGLKIVGAKLVPFSVAQAQEFYKPLKKNFEKKLEHLVKSELSAALETRLSFPVFPDDLDAMAKRLRKTNANYQFDRIIQYITGLDPSTLPAAELEKPGTQRCLVLIYYGPHAIQKIRDLLGATNPTEAAGGTVRSEFGHDVLKNGVHASDSPNDAMRERKIVGLLGSEKSELDEIIP